MMDLGSSAGGRDGGGTAEVSGHGHDDGEHTHPSQRRWSDEERARIVSETCEPGASIKSVAQRHGVSDTTLSKWRRRARTGCRPPPGGERGRSDCGRGHGSGSGAVIMPDGSLRIVVATRPVDFRRGHDALAATVSGDLGLDIYSGVVVIFRSKRGDRLKALAWDGSGLVLTYKRLEQGRFAWPRIEDGVMRLSKAQFEALFEGLDWRRVRARTVLRPLAAE